MIHSLLEQSFLEAAIKGDNQTIEACLGTKAEIIDIRDIKEHAEGFTVLHHAAQNGHLATVELLLEKGADINALTEDGRTVLHLAAAFGQVDIVNFLLEKGMDPQIKDKSYYNILDTAIGYRHQSTIQVVELLLNKGMKIMAKHLVTITLLDQMELLKFLLNKGINPNLRNQQGYTPLFWTQNAATVKLLLAHGADPELRSHNGKTIAERDRLFKSKLVQAQSLKNLCLTVIAKNIGIFQTKRQRLPLELNEALDKQLTLNQERENYEKIHCLKTT